MSKDIHEAINEVMQEVGYVKKQKGNNLNYTYAGEAALISALRPSMVEHGIYMHVLKIENVTRESYTTAKGTAMINTVISAIIRFTHVSGTSIDVASTGEGSDAGDKSANKAMTGLYKYAMRQTFCIETGDDPDKFQSDERKPAAKNEMTLDAALKIKDAKGLLYGEKTNDDLQQIVNTEAAPEEKKMAALLILASRSGGAK